MKELCVKCAPVTGIAKEIAKGHDNRDRFLIFQRNAHVT